jgi:two-component system response regulator HydG
MDDSLWILVVDCDAKLRFTISVILKRAGYSVVGVDNASDGLRQLSTRPFHLVLMDLCLPDIDGLIMLPEIQRLFPGIPVIILTGDDSVNTTMRALGLGACGYLLKPIHPGQILTCIEQVLLPPQNQLKIRGPVRTRRRGLTSKSPRATIE